MISDSECLVFSISDFTARETLESFATNLMHCFQQFYVIPVSSSMAAGNSPVFALAQMKVDEALSFVFLERFIESTSDDHRMQVEPTDSQCPVHVRQITLATA